MTRTWLGAAVAAVLLAGGPAGAAVVDPSDLVPAAEERALAAELQRVGPGRFEVAFVQRAPEGAVAAARGLFDRERLGPEDAAIVVAVGERRVGVHVGDGYRARGVDGRAIDALVASAFRPYAVRGDYDGAALALARGIEAEARGTASRGGGAGQGDVGGEGGGGFPWWLVVLPLAAGAWMISRRGGAARRARGAARAGSARERLAKLKASHGRLLEAALQLDEEGRRGRHGLATGTTTSRVYADLDRQTMEILTEANAVGEEIALAEQALAANKAGEADGILADVDRRLLPLEAELAAAVTAMAGIADDQDEVKQAAAAARARLDALRGRAVGENGLQILADRLVDAERLAERDPTAGLEGVHAVAKALDRLEGRAISERPTITWEELPRHSEELASRLADLAGAYEATRGRAEELGLPGDPEVEGRIDAARRRLGTAPVDLEEAAAAVAEARDALRRYQAHLDAAEEREARRPQQQPMGGMSPIIMMPPVIGGFGAFPGSDLGGFDGGGGGSSGGGGWDGGGGDGASGGGTW